MPFQDKSDYLAGKIAEHNLRGIPYTPPTDHYLALFTASPGKAGSLTNEVAAAEYHRQLVVFGPEVGGICLNTAVIQFAAALTPWGLITYGALFDALSAGNMLYFGPALAVIDVTVGKVYKIAIGQFSVGEA